MARILYLLRHAKAGWDTQALSDHDRPLTSRGQRAARRLAEHLRAEHIAPDVVLCSSSARTRETLKLISGGLAEEARVVIESGLYGATAGELLARLRAVDAELDSVMVIGHQPGIQQLAESLASGGEILAQVQRKFPTAALATLTFTCGWHELAPGAAELVAFTRPRDLGPPTV